MDHLVASAKDDTIIRDRRRRVKGKFPLRMFVTPGNLLLSEINAQHFVFERAVKSTAASQCRGCASVRTRRNVEHLFSVRETNCAEDRIASRNEGHASRD